MTKTTTPKRKMTVELTTKSNIHRSIVPIIINRTEEQLIDKYKGIFKSSDLQNFANNVIRSTLRWMQRMINGPEMYELSTMDYWEFDKDHYVLSLKNRDLEYRDYSVSFDMTFTHGDIVEYNQGMAQILNSFWYKIDATPPCVVELIACCDILYRQAHDNESPAFAQGVDHSDLLKRGAKDS